MAELRFIQICYSESMTVSDEDMTRRGSRLFGLTSNGSVYEYMRAEKVWEKVPMEESNGDK